MALQSSGAISASDINEELLDTNPTDELSFNSVKARDLADVSSGAISFSDFYSKSSVLIEQPSNISPANESIDIVLQPELESSNFSIIGDTDTLDQREYKIIKVSDNSVVYNPTI
jgi:hypothetical protein